jgi:hypothetical protein
MPTHSQSNYSPHYITALLFFSLITLAFNTKQAMATHIQINKAANTPQTLIQAPTFSPPLPNIKTIDKNHTSYIFKTYNLQQELFTILDSLKNINQEIAHIYINTREKEIHVTLKHM